MRRPGPTLSAALLLVLAGSGSALRGQEGTASVHGTVRASETGQPVADAVVLLDGKEQAAITDSLGRFILRGLDPGQHVLEVSHLGRSSRQDTVEVAAEEAVEVALAVEVEPVELPGLSVTVEGRRSGKLAGFYHRMERGAGHYITREEIEAVPGHRMSKVIRRVPNVNVQPCDKVSAGTGAAEPPPGCWQVRMRRKAPSIRFSDRTCPPIYYLDGSRIQLPAMEGGIDAIDSDEVAAIEVYSGPSEIPAHYGGSDAQCGVVLLWTRTGAEEREERGG